LAFLAALVLSPGRVPPFTDEEERLFEDLQRHYHRTKGREQPPLFRLSPALAPPPDSPPSTPVPSPAKAAKGDEEASSPHQAAPSPELTEKERTKLIEELLAAEERENNSREKRKTRYGAQRSNPQPKPPKSDTKAEREKTLGTTRPSASLEETLQEIRNSNPGYHLDPGELTSDEWTEVVGRTRHQRVPDQTKKGIPADDTSVKELVSDASSTRESINVETKPARLPLDSEDETRAIANTTAPPSVTERSSPPKNREEKTASTKSSSPVQNHEKKKAKTTKSTCNDSTEIEMLKAQVQQLRAALEEKDRVHAVQLDQLRVEHQQEMERALRDEREKSEERARALQLRLYIGDTKLRTMEEALQQHVASVAHVNPTAHQTPDRGGKGADSEERAASKILPTLRS
jgi:hypothetical protein